MNDRAVLITAALLTALLIGFGALWALRDYALPIFVNGNAVARQADGTFGDMIAARFPEAGVGPARCPRVLDLTGRRSAQCAIPVAGDELTVGVDLRMDSRKVEITALDAVFVKRDGERTIARDLEERYGERFTVQCPGAAVRVLHERTPVACTVEAPDMARRDVEAAPSGDGGDLRIPELTGVTSRKARVFGADAGGRLEGSVAVDGRVLERYLKDNAAFLARGEVGRRGLAGAAHCPARVALHEGSHVRCTVAVADVMLRYDVHFEKGLGLLTDLETSVAVVAPLREIATRYFARPEYTGGTPINVDVNCGTAAVVVMEPGSKLPCFADIGGQRVDFAIRFLDARAAFRIEDSALP